MIVERKPVVYLIVGVVVVLVFGGWLYHRAASGQNKIALAAAPKRVAVIAAVSAAYRPSRRYVGTVEPWVEAKVGPQLVAAYVDTVLVRPGMQVKRGDVIATLDCRNADAISRAVSSQARAVAAQQVASASEAARMASLDPKFVAQNDVDQKNADAASKQAQVQSLQAQAAGSSLQVNDCVLRAPFDGEVAARSVDPGAFVRPGSSIATIIDRHTVRVVADVPEEDFAAVTPGTPVRLHMLATNTDVDAKISRLAPSADAGTRTAHIEIDVTNEQIPVWTTAEISLDVGTPVPATMIPITSALVRGSKVNVFVVKGDVAKAFVGKLLGERAGQLYVDPSLAAGTMVVTEGRGQLDDGDAVSSK
jgi:membrane fusion protein (multidrug efflux system)